MRELHKILHAWNGIYKQYVYWKRAERSHITETLRRDRRGLSNFMAVFHLSVFYTHMHIYVIFKKTKWKNRKSLDFRMFVDLDVTY